jgi:hypothetical protein
MKKLLIFIMAAFTACTGQEKLNRKEMKPHLSKRTA